MCTSTLEIGNDLKVVGVLGGRLHRLTVVSKECLVLVVLGEVGKEPGQHRAVRILLDSGGFLLIVELLDKRLAVGLHVQEPLHVDVGQILVGALAGILLDGLGHHLGAGEILAVGSPLSVFGSAEDTSLLLESLGDLGVGVVDVDDSVLFPSDNLLISFIFVLRGFVFLLFSVPLCALSIAWAKRKSVL